MPEIEIQFRSEAEYRRLRAIRDKYGVQWRGMLIQGAKRLEGRALRFALSPDDLSPERQHPSTEEIGPSVQPIKSLDDIDPHDPASGPDTTSTDHHRESRLFDSSGRLLIEAREMNHEDCDALGLSEEKIER
jgi:hypothetical protein